MAFINSRKHPKSPTSCGRLSAATLLTGLALAQPAIAGDSTAGAAASAAQLADAKTLPGVKVEATSGSEYRVDRLASPKYTQPLLDTTQTISVITRICCRNKLRPP